MLMTIPAHLRELRSHFPMQNHKHAHKTQDRPLLQQVSTNLLENEGGHQMLLSDLNSLRLVGGIYPANNWTLLLYTRQ